jgi:hypothetical protein
MNVKCLLSINFLMYTNTLIKTIDIKMNFVEINCWDDWNTQKRIVNIVIFFFKNTLSLQEKKNNWFLLQIIEINTFEINDSIKVPLWSQKISILSKFEKKEHVKWNFEFLFKLISIGELNVDWNAIVLCFLKRFNNTDDDDDEEQLTMMIIDKNYSRK